MLLSSIMNLISQFDSFTIFVAGIAGVVALLIAVWYFKGLWTSK